MKKLFNISGYIFIAIAIVLGIVYCIHWAIKAAQLELYFGMTLLIFVSLIITAFGVIELYAIFPIKKLTIKLLVTSNHKIKTVTLYFIPTIGFANYTYIAKKMSKVLNDNYYYRIVVYYLYFRIIIKIDFEL